MKRIMTLLIVSALAMGMISAAQAVPTSPTTITITGTAGSGASQFGYTQGQSYSFTWVINSDFVNNSSSGFYASESLWADENVSETPVFTSLYGDGLLGTYVRPTVAETNPYEYIDQCTTNLYLLSGNDGDYSLGLTGSLLEIRKLRADQIVAEGFNNVPSASFVSPSAYYAARTGVYNIVNGQIKLSAVSGETLTFVANSMAIGTGGGGSPVPEPGTILAALSILGPAGMIFRRRKA